MVMWHNIPQSFAIGSNVIFFILFENVLPENRTHPTIMSRPKRKKTTQVGDPTQMALASRYCSLKLSHTRSPCYVFHYSRGIVPRSARVIRIDHDHQIL